MRTISEIRMKKNHQRRIEALKNLDQYIMTHGAKTFPDLIMEYDILRSTLYKMHEKGLLITTMADGKSLRLHGVNWQIANQYIPPKQTYRDEQLSLIASVTAKYGMVSLRRLSKKTGIEISTLRYWRNIGILSYKSIRAREASKIFITGVETLSPRGPG